MGRAPGEQRRLRVAFLVPYSIETASTRQRVFNNVALFPPDVEASIWCSQTAEDAARGPGRGLAGKLREVGLELARKLWHLWRARRHDVVVIQKNLTLFNWRGLPWLARQLCRRIVYDLDDAVHLGSPRGFRKRWLQALTDPGQALELMRAADAVTAGNSHLAAVAAPLNRRVHVVPTPMNTDRYRLKRVAGPGRVVVGWSGSSATNHYVNRLGPILARLARSEPRLEFLVISNDERAIDWSRFAPVPTRFVRFRLESLVEDLHELDVGVMPLDDDEWSRSKCGGKILQYMACGIVPVCSPVGINREIVRDGANGCLAGPDDEWVDKIAALVADPELRARLGQAARATIEERFSNAVVAPRLVAAIRDAAGPRAVFMRP